MIKYLICLFALGTASIASGSDPITIVQGNESSGAKQPQACISANGSVHVTFGEGEQVYYCRIDDHKCTAPKAVFHIPNMSLGMRRGPRIAHSGKAIVVTAIGGAEGKGKDGDVLAYRSLDNGHTWDGPFQVNDVNASAREGLHAMAAASDGTLWCVWLDLREKGTKLFASKSTDNGKSWSKNVLVYRSPDGSICECCHPSIFTDNNSVHVLFRNSLGGNRDMYLVSSQDQGTTFGKATRLGQGTWRLNMCPMDGGMVAKAKNGDVFTVWRRDRNVFLASAKNNTEQLLGTGEQPWIANDPEGVYVTWTSQREGDLMLVKPGQVKGEKVDSKASFPILVSASLQSPVVYLFWEKKNEQGFSILAQRIR